MLTQIQDAVKACAACSRVMKLTMVTPMGRRDGSRYYKCEYHCDCGRREWAEEAA